jgi:hypothetical protein
MCYLLSLLAVPYPHGLPTHPLILGDPDDPLFGPGPPPEPHLPLGHHVLALVAPHQSMRPVLHHHLIFHLVHTHDSGGGNLFLLLLLGVLVLGVAMHSLLVTGRGGGGGGGRGGVS